MKVCLRYVFMAGVVAFVMLMAGNPVANAADVKLGFIDSQAVLNANQEYQDAVRQYELQMSTWRDEAQTREQEIMEMRDQIDKQSMMWSEDRKGEMQKKLRQRQEDYQRFVEDIFGDQGRGVQMQVELAQPIFDKINTILREMAEEGDYTMIFDTVAGSVLYADPGLDLTDDLIDRLNEKYEEAGGGTSDQNEDGESSGDSKAQPEGGSEQD